jgi:hypothetical protein
VLVAHGAIEASLRHVVARGFKVHLTELLIYIVLRKQRQRCRYGESRDANPEERLPHSVPPFKQLEKIEL